MKTPIIPECPVIEGKPQAVEVSRALARRLAAVCVPPQTHEPYRNYAFTLPDGRLLSCPPNGRFYVMPNPSA